MSYDFEWDLLKSRTTCQKADLLSKYPTVVPSKVYGNMIFSQNDVPEGYSYLGCCDYRSEKNDMHCMCRLHSTIKGVLFDVRESRLDKSFKQHLQAPAFLSVGSVSSVALPLLWSFWRAPLSASGSGRPSVPAFSSMDRPSLAM